MTGPLTTASSAQPPATVPVVHWTLIRVRATGAVHVVGYRADNGRGRASSAVRAVDHGAMACVTSSGNRYLLVGPASEDGLTDAMVLAWLALASLERRDIERVGPEDL